MLSAHLAKLHPPIAEIDTDTDLQICIIRIKTVTAMEVDCRYFKFSLSACRLLVSVDEVQSTASICVVIGYELSVWLQIYCSDLRSMIP
jgi:hypothetical protein